MPIYEYFCQACKTQSEIMHKMADAPATVCPRCGKSALTKQVSAAAFRLKGAGWYETDFKTDKDKQKNLAGDASAPVEKKADAEPSAKPDAPTKPDAPAAAPAPAAKPAPAATPTAPATPAA